MTIAVVHRRLWHSLCLVLAAAFLAVGVQADPRESCSSREPLPANLELVPGWNISHSVHLHSTFRANFSNGQVGLTFSVPSESLFRLYLGPDPVLDVDISVEDTIRGITLDSGVSFNEEEMMALVLPPSSYRIVFLKGVGSDGVHARVLECYPLMIELAIAPMAVSQSRYTSWKSGLGSQHCSVASASRNGAFPSWDLSQTETNPLQLNAQGGISLDTAVDTPFEPFYSQVSRTDSTDKFEASFVKSWPISVGDVVQGDDGLPKTVSSWRLTARLGTPFLHAGQLRLVLTHANEDPADVCAFLLTAIASRSHPHCIVGTNVGLNTHVLSSPLLTSGNTSYTLTLLDLTGRRLPLSGNSEQCSPFAMSIELTPVMDRESFVSCDAELLPTSFNEPGMLPAPLHYKEHILIRLDRSRQSVPFKITEPSIIKIFTYSRRVDVDATLMFANGTAIASARRPAGMPDVIESLLAQADDYAVEFSIFGTYSRQFCESFELEVQIMPLTSVRSAAAKCSGRQVRLPDLSNMQTALNSASSSHSFAVEGDFLLTVAPADASRRYAVFSKEFEVSQASWIHLQLGANFLLGDLTLTLTANFSDGQTMSLYSDRWHARNLHFLKSMLAPNVKYTLTVWRMSESTGNGPSSLSARPSCVPFWFNLNIKPYHTSYELCGEHRELPAQLSSGEFMGLTDNAHLSEVFIMPARFFWFGSSDSSFSVSQRSYIRAVTRSGFSAVTFTVRDLTTDTVVLTSSRDTETGEVKLLGEVQPGQRYVFRVSVVYQDWEPSSDEACETFPLELVITPVSSVTPTPSNRQCAQEHMPSITENPLAVINRLTYDYVVDDQVDNTPGLFYHENVYSFTQRSVPRAADMPFTLQQPGWFRAQTNYRFVTGDIGLKLFRNSTRAGGFLELIAQSDNMFDSDELWPRRLLPGSYVLQVYEPAAQPMESLRQCVDFELVVAVQIDTSDQEVPLDRQRQGRCEQSKPTLPSTLNSVAFMSEFSGNQAHLSGNYWLGPLAKSAGLSVIPFNVSEPSYLRVVVSGSARVDVDISLRDSQRRQVDGMAALGYNEENIYGLLTPGRYFLQFRFYPQLGQRFPSPDDCVGFPLELSLLTRANFLRQFPQQPNPAVCPSPLHSDTFAIRMNSEFAGTFTRWINQSDPVSTASGASLRPAFTRSYSFEVLEDLVMLDVSLRYTFTEGAMYFVLDGEVRSERFPTGTGSITLYPEQSKNHLFLSTVLERGKYKLTVKDITSTTTWSASSPRSLTTWCSPFTLAWRLSDQLQAPVCDRTAELPTDLFSKNGGSQLFGGPQDEVTGEIRYSASQVSLPATSTHNYISFFIRQPSYLRVWTKSRPDDDIDILIYEHQNVTGLIAWSVGIEETESNVVMLNPKAEPYLLDLNVFYRGSEGLCPSFSLEIAIEKVTRVNDDYTCPPNPKLPSTSITLPANQDSFAVPRDVFTFTPEAMTRFHRNPKADSIAAATYSIMLSVQAPYQALFTQVGYDFLAVDMSMTLESIDRSPIIRVPSYSNNPGGRYWLASENYNFASQLRLETVPSGQYRLNITIHSHNLPTRPQHPCHRFSFSLAAQRNKTADPPTPPPAQRPVPPPVKPPVTQPMPTPISPPSSVPQPQPAPHSQPVPVSAPVTAAPVTAAPEPIGVPESSEISTGVSAPIIIGLVVFVIVLAAAGAVGYWWWAKRGGRNPTEQYVPLVQMEGDEDDEDFLHGVDHDAGQISDDRL